MANIFGNWSLFSKQSKQKNTTKKQKKKGILTSTEKLRYAAVAQNIVHGMDTYLVKYLASVRQLVDTKQIQKNYTEQYKKYYQDFKESYNNIKQRVAKDRTKVVSYLVIFGAFCGIFYLGITKGYNFLKAQTKRLWNMISQIGSKTLQVVDGILDSTQNFLRRVFYIDIDIKQWLVKIGKETLNAFKQLVNILLDGLWYLFCDSNAIGFIGQILDQVAVAAYNASFDSAWGWVLSIFFSRVQQAQNKINLTKVSQYGLDTYSKIVTLQSRANTSLSNPENFRGIVSKDDGFWGFFGAEQDEAVKIEEQYTIGWDGDSSTWRKDVAEHSQKLREALAKAVQGDGFDNYSQGQLSIEFSYEWNHSSYQEQSAWYDDAREFNPDYAIYVPTQQDIQNGGLVVADMIKELDDFMYKYRNQTTEAFNKIRDKWSYLRYKVMLVYQQGYSQQFKRYNDAWKGGCTYRQARQMQTLLYQCYIWQGKTLQKRIRMHDIMFHNRVQNSVIDKLLEAQKANINSLRAKSPLDQMVQGYMGYRLTFKAFIRKSIEILNEVMIVMNGGDTSQIDNSYGQAGAKLLTRHQFDDMFDMKWIRLQAYKARNLFKRIQYLKKGWQSVILTNDLQMNYDIASKIIGQDNKIGGTHDRYSRQNETGVRQSGDGSALQRGQKQHLIFAVGQLLKNLADQYYNQIDIRQQENRLLEDCKKSAQSVLQIWNPIEGKKTTTIMSNQYLEQVQEQFYVKQNKEDVKLQRYKQIPLNMKSQGVRGNSLTFWQIYENTQRQETCTKLGVPYVRCKN